MVLSSSTTHEGCSVSALLAVSRKSPAKVGELARGTRRRLHLGLFVAVVVGSVVGSSLVVLPIAVSHLQGAPAASPAPPFSFGLVFLGSDKVSGGFAYTYRLAGMSPEIVTTAGVQFYMPTNISETNRSPSIPSLVYLKNDASVRLASFNSTESSFRGPGSALANLSDYGGWFQGNGTRLLVGDTFEVVSSLSLVACTFWVAMAPNPDPNNGASLVSYAF